MTGFDSEYTPLPLRTARKRLGLAGTGPVDGDPGVIAFAVQECGALVEGHDVLFAAWLRLVRGPFIAVISAGEQVGYVDRFDAIGLVEHLRAADGADVPCVLAGQDGHWCVYVPAAPGPLRFG